MPAYEICYFNPDGTLAARRQAECADDREARILAHALKEKGRTRIRVWSETDKTERRLVYERPLAGSFFG
jgi:hypothetical protein